MDWHIFPRHEGDTPSPGPVWRLPREDMNDPKYAPTPESLADTKRRLNEALDQLLT